MSTENNSLKSPVSIDLKDVATIPVHVDTELVAICSCGFWIGIESLAAAVHKASDHIESWLEENGKNIILYQAGKQDIKAVSLSDATDLLSHETFDLDNPYAAHLFQSLGLNGMRSAMDLAEEEGSDSIDVGEGIKLKLEKGPNGEKSISLDSFASVLGVSLEELHNRIQSDDFAQFVKNQQDIVRALGLG